MRYKDATTENLPDDIKTAVKKSIEENKGLFLYGSTGTGKTYNCHALAKGRRAKLENFVSLLVEYRDYMQQGQYFTRIKELTNQEYLFIDDIGSEKVSDFVIEFLYMIINARYENMKRTVLTTNLDIKEFAERYGDRVLSRIAEMCVLVELKGNDRRI